MSSSEAKNLEAISRAIDQHNRSCEYPAVAVTMNPYEIERLGWDTIRGLPIRPDTNLGTGSFNVVCGGGESDEGLEETVEAVSEEMVPAGAPGAWPGREGLSPSAARFVASWWA